MIFSVSFPVMIYAFIASVHNMFGYDLIGHDILGDRTPVGAGSIVVFGMPFYIFGFVQSILKYFSKQVVYLEWDEKALFIKEPMRKTIPWKDIREIELVTEYQVDFLKFHRNQKRTLPIKMDYLDVLWKDLPYRLKEIAAEHNFKFRA